MKKFLVSVLAVLSCGVLSAAETDMYLYWMIDDNAKFDGATGFDLSAYNARIVSTVGGTGSSLMFYDSHDSLSGYLDTSTTSAGSATYVQGWDMVCRVGDLDNATFFIEIFNNDGVLFQSEWMSYTDLVTLGHISAMRGMVVPASTYGFGAFKTVPEPTSGLLLLIGVAGLALRRQKMKKA